MRGYACPLVEITGGEPLLQAEVLPLMTRLADAGQKLAGHGLDLWYSHQTRRHDWFGDVKDFSDQFRAYNGFVPQVGDTFPFLTFGSVSGDFAKFTNLAIGNGFAQEADAWRRCRCCNGCDAHRRILLTGRGISRGPVYGIGSARSLPSTGARAGWHYTNSATDSDALSTALLVRGPEGHDPITKLRAGGRTVIVYHDQEGERKILSSFKI